MKEFLKAWAFKAYGKISIEKIQDNTNLGEGKRGKIMISIKWLWVWFHHQERCSRNLRFFYHSSRGTKPKQSGQEYFLGTTRLILLCLLHSAWRSAGPSCLPCLTSFNNTNLPISSSYSCNELKGTGSHFFINILKKTLQEFCHFHHL